MRRARGRENLYLVHVAAQEVARRERRGSGTKQGAASDPTTWTPDCTKATSSSALASLRDFSNAARRRRRRAPMRPVEVICPTSCGYAWMKPARAPRISARDCPLGFVGLDHAQSLGDAALLRLSLANGDASGC